MTELRSLAVAQTCAVKGDVAANLDEHIQLAHAAHSAGARLVVFPELSLTGYEIGLARDLAFSESDARIAPLVDTASATGMVIVAGAPVRLGEQVHIAVFIISPDGSTSIYTKHRLGAFSESARCDGAVPAGTVPPAEATVFTAGDRNPLIPFGRGTAALAICADIGDPSHAERAAARGADAYLASMFVIPSEFAGDAAKLQRYAARHAMVVAVANYGSPTGGLAAAGRSTIWSQTGTPLVQLPPSGAGVAVATEAGEGWYARSIMLPARYDSDGRRSVNGNEKVVP